MGPHWSYWSHFLLVPFVLSVPFPNATLPQTAMRYCPQLALPPYSYVTHQWPHPLRDPDGHRFLEQAIDERPLDPAQWRDCASYGFAIDLFHAGYYWEAHEQWEHCWKLARNDAILSDFLKALIKLAAAGVKAREGNREGVQRHASRACELFLSDNSMAYGRLFAGLDRQRLAEHAQWTIVNADECVAKGKAAMNARVAILFPWRLDGEPN